MIASGGDERATQHAPHVAPRLEMTQEKSTTATGDVNHDALAPPTAFAGGGDKERSGSEDSDEKIKLKPETLALTAVDLLSGCGGQAQANRSAGYEVLATVEEDKHCADTLKKNGFNVINDKVQNVDFTAFKGFPVVYTLRICA